MAKHLKPRAKVKPTNLQPVVKSTEARVDNSPYVFQRDKIKHDLVIRELPWTEKQKALIELIHDKKTKIVFLSGVAGTSKTIVSAYCALKQLQERKVSDIVYVRSVVESASRSMGFLPGSMEDKLDHYVTPLADKMEELIKPSDFTKLLQDERIKALPVNFLRGASYNAKFVIADECQNFTMHPAEITTILTRIGNFSKFIFCGDPMQSDLKGHEKSGFKPMFDLFNNEESQEQGIYCVELGKEDIMRSEILKFIVEKLEMYK